MAPARLSGSRSGFSCPHLLPIRRAPASNRRAGLPCRVPPSLLSGGAGILTGCPSPTPLGLGLGPPNPTRTDLPSETLDLRRTRFSRVSRYSYRHSHFCALHCSSRYSFYARRTLPYQDSRFVIGPLVGLPVQELGSTKPARQRNLPVQLPPVASVPGLSPVIFSAQDRLTSELLRTLLRVAASRPTSWLS